MNYTYTYYRIDSVEDTITREDYFVSAIAKEKKRKIEVDYLVERLIDKWYGKIDGKILSVKKNEILIFIKLLNNY
jgi:hypothetical protein